MDLGPALKNQRCIPATERKEVVADRIGRLYERSDEQMSPKPHHR